MKLKLFTAFLVIATLLSCSGDDSSTINKNLKEINVTDISNQNIRTSFKFKDNKMIAMEEYNDADHLLFYISYEYSVEGLLSSEKFYYDLEGENVYGFYIFYEYDNKGRLIKTRHNDDPNNESAEYIKTISYSDTNNTISKKAFDQSGQEIYLTRFKLNDLGQIVKIYRDSGSATPYTEQVGYTNDNITSFSNDSNIITWLTYDMEHEPKGAFLSKYQNQFGLYKLNSILHEEHFIFEDMSSYKSVAFANFVSSRNNTSKFTYTYEFDSDGFPVNNSVFKDGSLYYKAEIIYE